MQAEIAIIGGSGLYDMDIMPQIDQAVIETPYGKAVANIGTLAGKKVAFVPRHGAGHTVPPHLVNYRANIAAMRGLGVKRILATASVGSLNKDMQPGNFVFLDQFIEFTKSRPLTFFEGGETGVAHTDMTNPYCRELRELMIKVSAGSNRKSHPRGVYVCTEGPRFETAAEINMYRILGGDVVGMTNIPEVVLAREVGICYAAVAVVTNFAAGISPNPLSHKEVLEEMGNAHSDLKRFLKQVVEAVPDRKSCDCPEWHEGLLKLK